MTSSFNPSTVTTPTPTGTAGDLSEKTSTLEPLVASVDSGPVQAYAKLEGDDFCYYIRTLQVTLGRRVSNPDNVDIPLGNTKSVSRQHANLFYNFTNRRFEMIVHGKNGAFVNEQFIEKGVTVPLDNKTKIQIGEMSFVFLLPRTTDGDLTTTTTSTRDNSFGYISTPHQLEKKNTKDVVVTTANTTTTGTTSSSTAAAAVTGTTDYDGESSGGDSGSESSEAYHHNKDVKPPYSYASLIAQAINSSNEKKMTLNGIYNYITTHYPYYQMTQNGWQNSIRHNLSLNKAFIKVPRGDDEPGKGAFWTIDSTAETQFTNGVYKRNKRNAPHSNTKSSDSDHPHQRKRLKGGESDGEEDSIMDKADDDQQHKMNDENNNDNDNDNSNDNSNEGEREEKQKQQQYKEEEKEQGDIKKSNAASKGDDNNNDVGGKDVNMESTEMSSTTTGEMGNINADTVTAATAAAAVDASNNSSQQQVESLKVVSDEVASSSTTSSSATATADNSQSIQVQLQLQLQNTIRQHLLDPVRYPLPSSIAQLLPQAIAQLPPQLANQLSSTLQSALKTKEEDSKLNEEKQ